MCILVALGLKPATGITLTENDDSPQDVRKALESLGLKVEEKPSIIINAVDLIISKDPKIIQEIKTLDIADKTEDQIRYGELMGYLPSMIDAYVHPKKRLPPDQWNEDIQIFQLILSTDHQEEEAAYLRQWREKIERYAPHTYEEILRMKEERKKKQTKQK